MTVRHIPDELKSVERGRLGRKLVVFGVLAFVAGAVGTVLATLLKVVWLGILGGPIGALSWLAVIGGAGAAVWGYLMVKDSKRSGG